MPSLKPPHRRHPHQSSSISLLLLPFLSLVSPTYANTEKAIFTGPEPITLSNIPSALKDQNIPVLGPSTRWSIRTNLTRVFPLSQEETEQEEQGYPSWLLLDNLTPGQRYELRVCWSALQPTAFTLDTYTLSTIFSTPSLLQSLTQHATTSTQQQIVDEETETHQQKSSNYSLTAVNGSSVLLLRVLAAADYFSHHSSLMKDPPPVLVDLILDPYLYNVLPQSLVPTVGYIVVISIVSWFVARWVSNSLVSVASSGDDDQVKKQN
ncbi:uncharacterized protein TrAtP1_005730 [Trichoderma atroviride]|uniref:Uncharacterized protein n=1 Tax=Hypocrea atroviridis (strain ATCC 20476 / IMI 206040) TaxID=452589 RepID=G9NSE4_HYPAI|nr:uncharacterized protein TRIATDRAFT_218231 [Trichoderma atroviride IMI 206040]EHK46808.1 hypothetical protein TRIATDRAFT_218231 [Trichoderma atroviride IMI 206040]UKZ64514.1 hypothetical protein TrAtP1_005730 [Trichoderma atroviride]